MKTGDEGRDEGRTTSITSKTCKQIIIQIKYY